MNKRKFLRELEKRLIILSDTEKEDILNEYRDIIEEKVKHGKTEEEAVKEFGSIDELSKEILSAYKINPAYQETKNEKKEKKEFMETTEDFIKKGAKKLSEVTEDVVEGLKESEIEFTTEKIFEIIIKVLVVLLGLAILKLPFYLVRELGSSIFSIGFEPFNWISEVIWKILVEIIYIVACVLVLFTLVSKYAKPKSKKQNKDQVEKTEEIVQTSKKKVKMDSPWDIILTIFKGFVCICFLFPLWCCNFGILIAVACVLYILWQGINVVGVLVLLLGLLFIGFEFCNMIYSLLFTKKHYHFSSLVIGFIMIILGVSFTFDYMSDFTYYDYLPKDLYQQDTITYEEKITSPAIIEADAIQIMIDNELEDDKIKLEVSYYKDYVTIDKKQSKNEEFTFIYFDTHYAKRSFNWKRDVKDLLIKHLEKKEIYNYSLLDNIYVKIYVNENTKNLIQ